MKIETVEDIIKGALKHSAVPLWPQMVKFNPPKPNPKCVPHIWRYDEVRPYLVRAGELVKEKDAERRVLMLVNPARGESSVVRLNLDVSMSGIANS
jgi:gentisate 1,2-dioxygenase